ncbi:hypothetical protein B0A52_06293 [Exophiala mesophila]|uniref:Urease accessory protein UreF n=1 Tax=Exophiala mesophila TaxID=212818 RepID=A0A438N304_EXOME|nr:hypothetical protein B0A52_06293 [Exophiala mesophila]
MNATDTGALRAHIASLEAQLQATKSLLSKIESTAKDEPDGSFSSNPITLPITPSLHNLMLLSDSAMPLGSFAYSSGLESFLIHNKPSSASSASQPPLSQFHRFLNLSVQSVAYTTIPYVLAAFRDPLDLMDLDNDLDASTPCTVARRASIAQGRALLSVWEKAFLRTARSQFETHDQVITAIEVFSRDLKLSAVSNPSSTSVPAVNGHLAPLWGVISLALGLNLEESGYLFLLNHAKAVVSAAVRASVMGPYMAQTVLAGKPLQDLIRGALEKVWRLTPEDAGQIVPCLDLWVGRHELLYSRIFNS